MKTETYPGADVVSAEVPPPFPANPAKDVTAEKLSHIWQQQLGVDSVGLADNFFDLGGDSSLAVRVFAQIEQVFGVKLPLTTLYEAPTVAELAQILRGEASASGFSPLVAIQPKGSRPPLFCMHGAGGTVLMYRDLARHLGEDQPVFGLQSQGLDGSCAPLTKIEEMAATYVREIKKAQPTGPYFIAGYCMGGTVAFEVAQQLHAQGETIALLALLDTMNWNKIPLNLWTKSCYWLQKLFFHAASFLSLDFPGQTKFLKEKIAVLQSRLPVWKGELEARFGQHADGPASNPMLLAQIWEVNDRASWNYLPKPFPGVLTDIRPAKQYWVFDKPELKWEHLAWGGQDVIVLPVNPATMLIEPFVAHLAAALRHAMDAAMERGRATSPAAMAVRSR